VPVGELGQACDALAQVAYILNDAEPDGWGVGVWNCDRLAADLAFGGLRCGRGVAPGVGVGALVGSAVCAFVFGGAAAGLVALVTLPSWPTAGPRGWCWWDSG